MGQERAAERVETSARSAALQAAEGPISTADSSASAARALLHAILAIGSELDLPLVLTRIIQVAVALSDAQYGALGVIGTDGKLENFVHVGVTAQQVREIGPLPRGEGVLGLLISDPHPIRVADLSAHSAAVGFPPRHPPMHTFLGVPIRVRGVVFGNLYLTQKHGGGVFSQEDEATVGALALAAGIAIENARLYTAAQVRERWLEAGARISREALSDASFAEVANMIAGQAHVLLDADVTLVVVPGTEPGRAAYLDAPTDLRSGHGPGSLRVVAAAGADAAHLCGREFTGEGDAAAASPWPEHIIRLGAVQEVPWLAPIAEVAERGPGIVIPIHGSRESDSAIIVVRPSGALAIAESLEARMVEFARQCALALELAARRREAERMAVLEDRERIGHDLHDVVIQRLFATGMVLQSLGPRITQPEVATRVSQVIDDLDETIVQIRSTIFALHAIRADLSVQQRIVHVLRALTPALGYTPRLRTEGGLDYLESPALEEHVVAVLTEAVSNVARHARANQVDVLVRVGREVLVRVRDNGVGVKDAARLSGLSNLAERARAVGGSFSVQRREAGGTELSWRAPVASAVGDE